MKPITAVMDSLRQNESDKQPLPDTKTHQLRLIDDDEGKKKLTRILHDCFANLDTYGRDVESLKSGVGLFRMILADYTTEQITEAFKYYLKHNSKYPTPADIATIIERKEKPPFSEAVYVNLCKKREKQPEQMEGSEWEYIREYENYILKG